MTLNIDERAPQASDPGDDASRSAEARGEQGEGPAASTGVLRALPTTAFVFAVHSAVAFFVSLALLTPLGEATGILGARALQSGDGAHTFETLLRMMDFAPAPLAALGLGALVSWVLSPWLLMTWLGAITRGEPTRTAMRSGWRHLPRTLWLRVILLVPQSALFLCWLLVVIFVHLATRDQPSAFGLPLMVALASGLVPYAVHRTLSDACHAALAAAPARGVGAAIGTGIRRLGVATLGLWIVLVLCAVALQAAAALWGGRGFNQWVWILVTQGAAAARWLLRGWWLSLLAPAPETP